MSEIGYFTYLARTVPKRDLARAIAVRARRALRRKPPAPTPAAERKKRALYALAGVRPGIVDPAEREFTAQLMRERWPAEAARVVEDAARARRGELPLFGRWKNCFKQGTSEIDYHRDPLTPWVSYDPAQPGDQVVLFQPGSDARVMWEVGRLQQLWRFAQARWLAQTAAERSEWARAWIDCVREFRTSNPAGLGVQWSCAMEVAFRATHVALTFAYIQDDPAVDETFAGELLDMLEEHCAYIEAHLEETGAVRTNHYAADLVGLVVVGALFPELGRSPHWARKLWDEIRRQVRPDGTHFESSTGYQRLCAELFLAALLAANAGGLRVPDAALRAVAGLFRSLDALLKPSGEMPQIGDFDSGRGLPLIPRRALDASTLAAVGAAALGDADLKRGACPPEVAWLFGRAGVRRYEALAERERSATTWLENAGIAALRAGDAWLCLSAGPNGQGGTGGHAHNDKNSVELAWGGIDLIVDRGAFVYARDPSERNARRGTAGHSTVQVDGLEQNRILPNRLFALPDLTNARVVRVEDRGAWSVATGEHSGYRRAGVTHRRTAALSTDAAAFIDELHGKGEHHFTQRWFVPHTDLVQREANEDERLRLEKLHEDGLAFGYDFRRCVAVRHEGKAVALFAFGATLPWTLRVTATDVSPGYAESAPAKLISLELSGAVPARLFTAVLFLRAK